MGAAAEAGLDPEATRRFLAGQDLAADVWDSQRAAADLGVSSVPFYVLEDRYAVAGGQPAGVWVRAFEAVEAELVP